MTDTAPTARVWSVKFFNDLRSLTPTRLAYISRSSEAEVAQRAAECMADEEPRPAESLSAAGEGQMDPICFGFCRTYAHEPALMPNGSSDDGQANDRRH
jgi:hypothetical protein